MGDGKNYLTDGGTKNGANRFSSLSGALCILASFSTMAYFPVVELLGCISIRVPAMLYELFNYAVFGTAFVGAAFGFIGKRGVVPDKMIKGFGLMFLVVGLYYVYGLFVEENTTYFLYFFLWAIPAMLVGAFVPTVGDSGIPKLLEVLTIMMGVASFLSVMRYLSLGVSHLNTLSFGGTNYQGLSYTAAFCVGLELYYVFIADDGDRFPIFRTTAGKIAEIVTGVLSAFSVVVSGGRGGFILMVVNTLLAFYLIGQKNKVRNVKRRALPAFIIVSIGVFVVILTQIGGNSLISDSLGRLSSVFSPTDQETSYNGGRNIIYSTSFELIYRSPVLGYGIFNLRDTGMAYPHNIVLETCMHAGVFYMLLWGYAFYSIWKNTFRYLKADLNHTWILLYVTYFSVFLNFSGTYLWCSQLWFIIGVLCANDPAVNEAAIDKPSEDGDGGGDRKPVCKYIKTSNP